MSHPAEQRFFICPRKVIGFPELIAGAATATIVLQVILVFASAAPFANWFAWIFIISGMISFFGTLGLAIWRRSLKWILVFIAYLLFWTMALVAAYSMAISRMH